MYLPKVILLPFISLLWPWQGPKDNQSVPKYRVRLYVTFRVLPDPEVLPAESRQDQKLIILALNHSRMAWDKTRGTDPACMHIFFQYGKIKILILYKNTLRHLRH